MFEPTRMSYIFASVLIAALVSGVFVHATVPHEHSHDSGGAESALWSDLHAILGSAQRKISFAAIASVLLLLLFRIARYGEEVFLLERRRERELTRLLDPVYGELLRRGVMPYRAFR